MKIWLTILLLPLALSIYSQTNYSICKVDSGSQRVFVYSKRPFIADLTNVKKVVAEIEADYKIFNNLNISFFDNKENCGYQIESVVMSQDSIVDIKVNNVKKHWFAEYSKQSGKVEYFKDDGSFLVTKEFLLKKE